jgi:hypothetical protein
MVEAVNNSYLLKNLPEVVTTYKLVRYNPKHNGVASDVKGIANRTFEFETSRNTRQRLEVAARSDEVFDVYVKHGEDLKSKLIEALEALNNKSNLEIGLSGQVTFNAVGVTPERRHMVTTALEVTKDSFMETSEYQGEITGDFFLPMLDCAFGPNNFPQGIPHIPEFPYDFIKSSSIGFHGYNHTLMPYSSFGRWAGHLLAYDLRMSQLMSGDHFVDLNWLAHSMFRGFPVLRLTGNVKQMPGTLIQKTVASVVHHRNPVESKKSDIHYF